MFAPLDEVADIALQGILADQFWIYLPNDRTAATIDGRACVDAHGLVARLPGGGLAVERPEDLT